MINTLSELNTLWYRVLENLSTVIEKLSYDSFFSDSRIHRVEGNEMTVVVNSRFASSSIEANFGNFGSAVANVVREVTQSDFKIKFIAEEDLPKIEIDKNDGKKKAFFANSEVNPKFTFDTFVVGASNREAYQAALMASRDPGKFYNPLFIYSQSGLGKTHLLHAIGNYVRGAFPRSKVLYISSDGFVDEYIKYVRGDQDKDDLKEFLTSVDVLLVDDIQFLADKPKTEEMFFFIFNALVNNNKQIVLTSDRHPSELRGLEDRLVTRFSSGLNINISRPTTETLIAILKKKIEANGLDLTIFDEDVITFFAERFSNNVRELEGALNRLIFYAINMKQSSHVDLNLAIESVESLIGSKASKKKLDEIRIVHSVADYYNLTPSQLTGKIRTSQISLARHIAIYLCRYLLDMPFTKIGLVFGGKDHSTIMSAVKKVENSLKNEENLRLAVAELKKRLS